MEGCAFGWPSAFPSVPLSLVVTMAQEGMNLGVGFGKPVVESGCREMAKQPVLHAIKNKLKTKKMSLKDPNM